MKMLKQVATATMLLGLLSSSGCAAFGKMVVGMMTTTTADLSVCDVQTKYISNIYPQDAATVDLGYYGAAWQAGQTAVVVRFSAGATSYQLDGTVMVDGENMEYIGAGAYAKYFKVFDGKSKKVSVRTSSGQQAEFTVEPPKPFKLVSINGATADAKVDIGKNMTLEFDNASSELPLAHVSLITNTMGMRNFADIGGLFQLAKKVEVPAPAFLHRRSFGKATARAGDGQETKLSKAPIVQGPNYVLVEQSVKTSIAVPAVRSAENIAVGWSWMYVTVSGEDAAPTDLQDGDVMPRSGA